MIELFNSLTVTGKIKFIICFPFMWFILTIAYTFTCIGNFAGRQGEKFSYAMTKFLKGDNKGSDRQC